MFVALILAGSHGGGGVALGQFVDPPALVMVVGGGLSVVLTSVSLLLSVLSEITVGFSDECGLVLIAFTSTELTRANHPAELPASPLAQPT